MKNKLFKATVKQDEPLWARPNLKMPTLRQVAHRTGSLSVLDMPSRMGNTLYYPDGRQVKDEVKG